MLGMSLDTLYAAPRDPSNPRLPKTGGSPLIVGRDGKYYKLVDSRAASVYRTLNEGEAAAEHQELVETQEQMLRMLQATHKGSRKHFTVRVGTASRDRQRERRKWERSLRGEPGLASAQNSTAQQLWQNTLKAEGDEADEGPIYPRPGSAPADLTTQTFSLIKDKYEENLHVVEALFEEKLSLEAYTRSLEAQLQQLKGREVTEEESDGEAGKLSLPQPDSLLPPKPSRSRPSSATTSSRGRRKASASPHIQAPLRSRSVDGETKRRRSLSGLHLSAQLQADIDRYNQRRQLDKAREDQLRKEQQEYEQSQRQRMLEAALHGRAFEDMTRRQQRQEELRQAKQEEVRKQAADRQRQAQKEREEKRLALQQSMQAAIRGHVSWKELQEEEDQRRRERIEKRKQELLILSSLPKGMSSASTTSVRRSLSQEPPPVNQFQAEDPAHIAAKLSKQQQLWEQRLEKEKAKLQQRREKQKQKIFSPQMIVMEQRAEAYRQKRAQRKQEQLEQEERMAEKKREAEFRHREQLMSASVQSKVTKAAKLREEQIRSKLEAQEWAEKQEQAKLAEKARRLKETSSVMKVLVRERIEEIKSKKSDYLEVSQMQQLTAERAASAREEFKRKAKENQRKIQEALANRPSLMDRHNRSIAERNATTEALQRLSEAMDIKVGKNSTLDDILNDDIFDAKEKAVVKSLRTSP